METKTSVDEESKNSITINEPIVNEIKKPTSEKIEWVVVLRAFACMAVIMIHVIGTYYENLKYNQISNYSLGRFILMKVILQPFIRFAVPCFIMISGYLLLDPKKDFGLRKIIKYIVKVVFLFLIFRLGYALFRITNLKKLKFGFINYIWTVFLDIYHNYLYLHLWYLPMLISLYILTPVLRKFVEHADKHTAKFVLIALFITTSVLPTINNYFLNAFIFSEISVCILVYLLGYYLVHTDLLNEKWIYICGVVGFIMYMIACCFGFDDDQLSTFMILETMMIVKLFSTNKIKIKSNKIINCVSKYSLGIYLVHMFWILYISKLPYILSLFPMVIGELVFFLYTLIMSLLSSMILYRLPLVKKLFKP